MGVPQFGDPSGLFPIHLGELESNEITRSVTDTIGFTQSAVLGTVYALAADRLFFFGAYDPGPSGEYGQLATHNYFYEDANNSFAFSNVAGYNWFIEIRQWLGFTDRYNVGDFGNYLGLRDSVRVAVSESLGNTFSFNQHGGPNYEALTRAYNATNSFSFGETIVGGFSEDVRNDFDLEDLIDSSATEFERDFTQSCVKQHVSYRITGPQCQDKQYSPAIGESGDTSYPEVPSTPPTLGSGVLTLTYPRITPTTTLVLKNPEFGNADTLSFTKIDRTTRGGERKIYSDTKWASSQAFQLQVRNVCDPNIDEILAFLNASLGKEIGLLDWEGRTWKGIIVAPETEVSPQVGGFEVSIIFEGELA
jgi:hypothetical protein